MENFILEIGAEEIPAGYIQPALNAMSSSLLEKLSEARIEHGNARIYGTPRRLAVFVENVARKQTSTKSEVIGPPAKVGFDENGHPTMAAQKFAEKVGLPVTKLTLKETSKGSYLAAEKIERGLATRTLLKSILPEVILSTPFPKKMRWADLEIEFARPIHTIVALLGKSIVSFKLGNIKSGRYTFGHRFMAPGRIKLDLADDYLDKLRSAWVLADLEERRKLLVRGIAEVAEKLGGRILPDDELVDIVNNLVEYPVPVAGKFDGSFLEVPDEVLINAMREHQKYFAVADADNKLMPNFIAVNNTVARDLALAAVGHERVLRARLADAQFFYRGDLEISNDERVEKLKGVLFQAKLGSMYEKTERVAKIAGYVTSSVIPESATDTGEADLITQVSRAARLSKADLVSQVVGEFPKLQGVMGRVYAAVSGEPTMVAAAIEEHYRPIYSGAPLPESLVGAILSIADKIDSICGCFSAGLTPTGASDPYALRRQGIGIVQIMKANGFFFSLRELIGHSMAQFGGKNDDVVDNVLGFLQNRIAHLLAEDGYAKDTIAAVLSAQSDNIPQIWSRVEALENLKAKPDFEPLAVAFKRVVNILKKAQDFKAEDVDQKMFQHESEAALLAAYETIKKKVEGHLNENRFDEALVEIASLREAVDAFFDGVMVMADDPDMRRNRLALLGLIAGLFGGFADFSKLSA
ncbi:MAG: glycine--tRNA ligase subunit beta [Desulfobacterales bacterium]|jgi:glycyl-tRNA synthetase beta chain